MAAPAQDPGRAGGGHHSPSLLAEGKESRGACPEPWTLEPLFAKSWFQSPRSRAWEVGVCDVTLWHHLPHAVSMPPHPEISSYGAAASSIHVWGNRIQLQNEELSSELQTWASYTRYTITLLRSQYGWRNYSSSWSWEHSYWSFRIWHLRKIQQKVLLSDVMFSWACIYRNNFQGYHGEENIMSDFTSSHNTDNLFTALNMWMECECGQNEEKCWQFINMCKLEKLESVIVIKLTA